VIYQVVGLLAVSSSIGVLCLVAGLCACLCAYSEELLKETAPIVSPIAQGLEVILTRLNVAGDEAFLTFTR
jgi:hypothetical protein